MQGTVILRCEFPLLPYFQSQWKRSQLIPSALHAVPTKRLLFQHIHKFLLCKDVRPRKRSLFHCPLSRVSLVSTDISVGGKFDVYKWLPGFSNVLDPENRRFWIYQNLERTARFQRRTGGYLTNSNCFLGPWVIHGYLIFLRIVIMNLKKLPWYPAGVRAVYNTRPTMVYIPRSSHDSTKTSSIYLPPNRSGGQSSRFANNQSCNN